MENFFLPVDVDHRLGGSNFGGLDTVFGDSSGSGNGIGDGEAGGGASGGDYGAGDMWW